MLMFHLFLGDVRCCEVFNVVDLTTYWLHAYAVISSFKLSVLQIAQYVEGGWIQNFKPSAYKFPDSEKALADAVEVAGPTLGPVLLSMSEFLMSSFNESYESRCVNPNI